MEITKDTIIGDVVTADYKAASVFKKFGIDFCCNGNRSIGDACAKDNINTDELLTQLKDVPNQAGGRTIDYTTWPLDLLADYIEKTHHRYVETKSLEIKPYLDKITRVHGERHPELAKVNELFNLSAGNLAMHMKKEELTYFPKIRKMVDAERKGEKMDAQVLASVKTQIETFLKEHDDEGEHFRQISALTNGFTVPEDGCNTYRVTLAMIQEFEEDLHLHIHLENNILFPKSIATAGEMLNN
ncbi:MAG: iron-sulfur cluster repair di-iron protein [Brumimicrobium sp.]|nr:iron-sulfur cluster repair di-iron protein [Brumimicrobium sp.]